MNSSSAFRIGSTHKVCQDYAVDGVFSNVVYTAISDGCSSSPNSEFGSIVQSLAFKAFICDDKFADFLDRIKKIADLLNLPYESLDATLLTIKVIYNYAHISCVGDGVIAIVDKDDLLRIIDIEFPSNAPMYYSYLLNKDRLKKYEETFGMKKIIRTTYYDKDFNMLKSIKEIVECSSENIDVSFMFHLDDVKIMSVMSDGVKSFYKTVEADISKYNEYISFEDIVMKFMNIKSFTGNFMERRINKLMKEFSKDNIKHSDDISIGTIVVE